ncbi:MAG: permease [Flavobacteriaceae bacterium]|nr:permease [Flavobacteriaceae bacterium]
MFEWLQQLADWIVYDAFNIVDNERFANALNFFIYDSIKILLLLIIVIFLMGIVNSYFPINRVRNFLSRKKLYGFQYLMASLFGVVTPFCSCSSVPLFIGFVKGGIPLGVTFAFLITSPLVNEIAIGLFIGLFGVKTTIIYVISGILLGTFSGMILQKLHLEKHLTPWVQNMIKKAEKEQNAFISEHQTLQKRFSIIRKEAWDILKGVLPYVLLGISIGALIHGYIPEDFFVKYMSKNNLFAVPIATLTAVPFYMNASGVLPVVQALVAKGIPLGTAIAFMMGVVGLSLPEAMLLKKVMNLRLIAIFFSVVTLCIIFSGYLFNMIL